MPVALHTLGQIRLDPHCSAENLVLGPQLAGQGEPDGPPKAAVAIGKAVREMENGYKVDARTTAPAQVPNTEPASWRPNMSRYESTSRPRRMAS